MTRPKRRRSMWRDSFIDIKVAERRPEMQPTTDSIVKHVIYLGHGGSRTCFAYPVRLPRVRFLETAHA